MANQKITDLVQIETISSDDVLPIVDISDNITKKINITQNLFKNNLSLKLV